MEKLDEIRVILSEVEDRLVDRLLAALEDRSYSDIATIAAITERVRDLIDQLEGRGTGSGDNRAAQAPPTAGAGPVAEEPAGTSPSSERIYPQFARQSDRLVKIGWSKKAKSEYRHKASRAALMAVAAALRELEEIAFSMADVLPVAGSDGEEIPSYQAYLALAWLHSWGAVRREGRGDYVPVRARLQPASLTVRWNELAVEAGRR